MKNNILTAFIIWMIISFLLVISIVGLLLFVRSDNGVENWQGERGRSGWMKIGIGLYESLISK